MFKKPTYFCAILLIALCHSCWWPNESDDIVFPEAQSLYEPVIMNRSDFEETTKLEDIRAIENSGKIYVKGKWLFVNEVNKGFHVFDNGDPSNPRKIAFLSVLGSSDIAIKNDMLYINNATDLIAVISDFEQNTIEITKRIKNTFPQLWSPDGFQYFNLQQDEIIVDWVLTE